MTGSVPHRGTIEDSNPPTTTSSSALSSFPAEPSPAPAPYIVLLSSSATAQEIQSVNSTLVNEAAPNSLSETVSNTTGLVVFFKAGINPSQADSIRKAPGVDGVFLDETLEKEQLQSSKRAPLSSASLHPRDHTIRLQSDAVDELKVISQPVGANLAALPGYGYAHEAGRGVTIYVVDTGVYSMNSEWSDMPGTKDIIYLPGAAKNEKDFLNHGTCVASKAGGPVYGTAKDANMVVVKLPRFIYTSDLLKALREIKDDVITKDLQGKAVVNFSHGHLDLEYLYSEYEREINALIAQDVVIVAASGNNAKKDDDVNTYPALFGETKDIIVVGAVDDAGHRAPFSQGTGSQLTVSAPGYVDCANGREHPNTLHRRGTSFAAPTVAGVIAVWLSQEEHKATLQVKGQVAARVKKMVQDLAYSRVEGGPPVIWNGIDPRGLS
ncbi:subtilisin-like protein [Colletotrichum eremochloae]|nr:subtilisin-like protein [Colletotrichum eremochloae]